MSPAISSIPNFSTNIAKKKPQKEDTDMRHTLKKRGLMHLSDCIIPCESLYH